MLGKLRLAANHLRASNPSHEEAVSPPIGPENFRDGMNVLGLRQSTEVVLF